jgi:hypothetical protein
MQVVWRIRATELKPHRLGLATRPHHVLVRPESVWTAHLYCRGPTLLALTNLGE